MHAEVGRFALKSRVIDNLLSMYEFVSFSASKFSLGANFEYAQFNGKADFAKSYFNGAAFLGTQFKGRAEFSWTIYNRCNFSYAHFYESANFFGARFDEYVTFCGARFDSHANFLDTKISGVDSPEIFKIATFKRSEDEETVCRKAKKLMEEQGNKKEADNYFYREMAAGRRLKPRSVRYPEYIFMQLIFGYGVHPWRLIIWWGIIVLAFAVLYGIGNGINGATQLFDYIKFSFATAIAPGYIATIINPGSAGFRLNAEYQAVAMAETIFGTLLWAAFIATFARKYMR